LTKVLFILADDMGAWAMGCAGNPEIRTPNLDRLASRGIRFENFFCASPVCSPARASILTGRIPSAHGVHDWLARGNTDHPGLENFNGEKPHPPIQYLEGMTAYTDVLAAAGYRCGLVGKWHLGASETPQKGFESWFTVPLGYSPYFNAHVFDGSSMRQAEGYISDVITEQALSFLSKQDGRPYYLSVHYTAPHSPWNKGEHPARYFDAYKDCAFKSCPELPLHPWQMNSTPLAVGKDRHEFLSGYFAAIEAMDAGIGRLLEAVGPETLVVFSGDNGMNMGHHGIFGKGNGTYPQNMYDTSVKVPFIMSRPGRLPQGAVNEDLLSHYDFMPTLLEFLGLSMPASPVPLPGRSFAPLLDGLPLGPERSVVVFDEYGPVRMIRDKRHKYVQRSLETPCEFYDLEADPGEERNLIEDPSAAALVRQYRERLLAWFERYSLPQFDGGRLPVTGKGQLLRLGPGVDGQAGFAKNWKYWGEGKDGIRGKFPTGPEDW
jgi:arylsulfatase A-like enzyme